MRDGLAYAHRKLVENDPNASRNFNADSPKVTTDYVYCPLQQAMVQVYRIALLAPFDRLFA